jgi:hypothetical protein
MTTAVPQLLYPEAATAEWVFPQEKLTLHDARKGTRIVEPLQISWQNILPGWSGFV